MSSEGGLENYILHEQGRVRQKQKSSVLGNGRNMEVERDHPAVEVLGLSHLPLLFSSSFFVFCTVPITFLLISHFLRVTRRTK